ncbi:MAG: sigma-70 family RNA polymerase sigma factor [Bacteroidota bacterium]
MAQTRERTIQRVIKEYNRRLFGFIRGRVSNNDDAEDVLQEVWYQLSRVVDIDSIEQISAWLFRVARNTLTDRYRKKKPELLDDQTYADDEGEGFIRDLLLDDTPGPEMEYLRELFWEELMEALDELPENQREVFVWNELEGQTFQEISDRTGIKLKTLISRKRYAVAHLRERLALLYEEFLAY